MTARPRTFTQAFADGIYAGQLIRHFVPALLPELQPSMLRPAADLPGRVANWRALVDWPLKRLRGPKLDPAQLGGLARALPYTAERVLWSLKRRVEAYLAWETGHPRLAQGHPSTAATRGHAALAAQVGWSQSLVDCMAALWWY